jgi:hypothetical protein
MKLSRILASLAVIAVLAGVAYVGQVAEPPGVKMANAADKFLASLTPERRTKATYAFEDKERTNWWFTPQQDNKTKKATRKGLPLEEMTAEQQAAAMDLVKAGTSMTGYQSAETIMGLEAILREQEKGGQMVRNPGWYFFTVFGKPAAAGPWGWRVEGHHLSLNFTLDGGKVVAATPAFFGANPATIKYGPRKGHRTLATVEDLAWALFRSLDPEQAQEAKQKDQFREIEEAKPKPNVGPARGLAGAKMNEKQRGILMDLVKAYANRMPPEVAESEMNRVKEAGLDRVHFAYAGGTEAGTPHSYRVQGPTFVVEFLNVQGDSAKNPANHIHSAWRNLNGDFGLSGK